MKAYHRNDNGPKLEMLIYSLVHISLVLKPINRLNILYARIVIYMGGQAGKQASSQESRQGAGQAGMTSYTHISMIYVCLFVCNSIQKEA